MNLANVRNAIDQKGAEIAMAAAKGLFGEKFCLDQQLSRSALIDQSPRADGGPIETRPVFQQSFHLAHLIKDAVQRGDHTRLEP